jgi:serine/threonine protein phosphatase PrpC
VTIDVALLSHRGAVRNHNEDHGAIHPSASTLEPDDERGSGISVDSAALPLLALVADGLGGHPHGDVASRLAVAAVVDSAPADPDELVVAVHAASESLYTAMRHDDSLVGMGTTLAAILVHDGGIAVANVGDSPVHMLVDDGLVELSTMDSLTATEDPSGRYGHVVTQTLGGTTVPEPVWPHLFELDADVSVRLLLATDGLADYADEAAIVAALQLPTPIKAATALVEAALAGGGGDNVTVAVVDVAW